MVGDKETLEKMIRKDDRLVYEFYDMHSPETSFDVQYGTSITYPGKVGNEYFMTKGHFHNILDMAEIYYCLRGHGYMLMENPEGEWDAQEMTPGANSRGVAELTIGLMFSLVRSIPQVNNSIKSGDWDRPGGMEIQGKILGVVGTGMIGQQVISMATGMGMRILACDLYPNESLENRDDVQYCSMEELLGESDIVTLHCPAGNTVLIGRTAITQMKQGSCLINTARSALVDDQALLTALESGKLSGYAADVFDNEPPELTALLLHERVITTAHIGGFTTESVDRAARAAVKNILEILEG